MEFRGEFLTNYYCLKCLKIKQVVKTIQKQDKANFLQLQTISEKLGYWYGIKYFNYF